MNDLIKSWLRVSVLRPGTIPTGTERNGAELQCRGIVHERALDIPVSVLRVGVSGKPDKEVTALLESGCQMTDLTTRRCTFIGRTRE